MTGMDLTPDQRRLADLMSDLSEACWAAAWMDGTEFDVWALLVGDRTAWGLSDAGWKVGLILDGVAEMRRLSEACGSWIVWDDGPTAVPLDEWKRRYAERRAAEEET